MSQSPDPVPIETLLRYRGWLRSLIRELVSDPDLADDVEQATWAVAIRRPPRHRRGLGAWLARVAASRVKDSYRREQRRHHRETSAARTAPSASTEELVGRAELQRRVADAVLALKEPYRTAVLQRYFDDRSPVEIADAMGLPLETVRTHLKRGKAKLRVMLDQEYGGRRGPWMLAGMPLLRDSVPGEVVRAAATGALMMSTKKITLCALVALLLLGVGLVAWEVEGDGSDGQEQTTPEGLSTAPGERTDDAPGLVGSGSAEGREGREVPPTTHARVSHGVVRDAQYRPLSGVSIRARSFVGLLGKTEWKPLEAASEQVLVSDSRGRFSWPIGSSEQPWTLVFDAQGDNILSSPRVRRVAPGAPAPNVSILVNILDRVVSGRVLDAKSGSAVQGARIFLWGHPSGGESKSGMDGSYSLRVPGSRGTVSIGAIAPDYAADRQTASVTTDDAGMIDFRLHADVAVSGQVTRASGDPVPGALVRSSGLAYRLSVRSGPDGRYVLRGMGAKSKGATIMATHPIHGSAFVALRAEDLTGSKGAVVRDIVLPEGVNLRGRVIGPDGDPVGDVRVIIGQSESSWNTREAWTDTAGHFEFEAAEIGPTMLIARAPGYSPTVREVTIDFSMETVPPLRMEKGEVLEGRVTDVGGRGLANVYVGARRQARRDVFLGDTYTDALGDFRFDRLPTGRIRLYVGGHGFENQGDLEASSGQHDVHVVLHRAPSISGRVIDSTSGEPVRAFRVRIVGGAHYNGSLLGGVAFRSEDGTWDSGPLEPWPSKEKLKDTAFVVSADGYAPQLLRVEAKRDSAPSVLIVRLGNGGTVLGAVRDAEGEPVDGAVIAVSWADVAGMAGARTNKARGHLPGTTTNAEGRFRIARLPTGTISLKVTARSFRPAEVKSIQVRDSRSTEHDVVLGQGAEIAGVVFDSVQKPRSNIGIHLGKVGRRPEDVRSWKSKTDTHGRFAFSGLDAGTYMVTLVEERHGMPSYWRTTLRVDLSDGATSKVSFAGKGSARVRGRVTGTEHLPPDALVVLEPLSNASGLPARRDRAPHKDGLFEFEGVPEGTYRLRINHSDWSTKYHFAGVQEIRVQEGGVIDVQVAVTATQG